MSERLYTHNRQIVFEECGLKSKDKKTHNCHHVIHKRDLKRQDLKDFNVNDKSNLIPLKTDIHDRLHQIIDGNKEWKNDISLRVYFANMAFNQELDDIPNKMYRIYPDIIKR